MPTMDTLDSMRLQADAMHSFTRHCLAGPTANAARMEALSQSSLMLVTALTPHIGYDQTARIAKHAHDHGSTLRAAALAVASIPAGRLGPPEPDAWPGRGLAASSYNRALYSDFLLCVPSHRYLSQRSLSYRCGDFLSSK